MDFIGREKWIKRFEGYLEQPDRAVWGITGQPGIGKSRLLRRFAQCCEQQAHPYVLLEGDGYKPSHALSVLTDMANLSPIQANPPKKLFGVHFPALVRALRGALGLAAATVFPEAVIGMTIIQICTDLGVDVAEAHQKENAEKIEREAKAHPERWLLKGLVAATQESACSPVCLIDTYEHFMDKNLKIKTHLVLEEDDGMRETSEETEVVLFEWLGELLRYLHAKGWRIVLAGRNIPRILHLRQNEVLEYFSDEEILAAAKTNKRLWRDANEKHRASLLTILKDLSFGGNPLWLQLAMNLLEVLLDEGRRIDQLAQDRKVLHAAFEHEAPLGVGDYEKVEFQSCKLAIIRWIFRSFEGQGEQKEQAWKIALPRVLDTKVIALLMDDPQLAEAIRENFNLSGMFRKIDKDQFALHEEIRDLLLTDARIKGYLNTQEARNLHRKLWVYLNEINLAKLPPELKDLEGVFSKIQQDANEKKYENRIALMEKLASYFNPVWMHDATYHGIMSLEKIPGGEISPQEFWLAVGGSASLSSLEKWWIANKLFQSEVSSEQIQKLIKIFTNELENWNDLFGSETTKALREECLTGNARAIYDLSFWERRVAYPGLAGDYFREPLIKTIVIASAARQSTRRMDCRGALPLAMTVNQSFLRLIQVLETYGEYGKSVEKTSKLLERYGNSTEPEVQTICAKAMLNKALTLGETLGKPKEAVATYDELLNRYGNSTEPELQTQCAKAMVNKGVTLGGDKLNNPKEAVATYNKLLECYGDSTDPEIQTLCAKAMFNKGGTLGKKLGRLEEAVATYNKLLNRYGDSTEPEVQTICAEAMFNKAFILGEKLGKLEEAVATFDELLNRYSTSTVPEIQAPCRMALENSVEPLLVMGQNARALLRIEQALAQSTPADKNYAIMIFLSWLAKPDSPLQTVLDAIHAQPSDIRFAWSFNLLRRSFLPNLPEPRRTQAECFMDFFEQHHDRDQLEQCLRGDCPRLLAQE